MSLTLIKHTFKVMGGPAEIQIYLNSTQGQSTNSTAQTFFQLAVTEAQRLEKKYSRYLSDSITSRINQSAGQTKGIQLDAETCGLLDYAQTAWQHSDGLFDITSGILRHAWDFKTQKLPNKKNLQPLLNKIGWDKLSWQSPTLTLPKGMEIDFGGVVKEYAADTLASLLRQQGIQHGLVELAGDISIIGAHPNGAAWKIGIRNPKNPSEAIASIDAVNGGIASSGNYERFMLVNNKRYCHILNPKTGWPTHGVASVSVHASTCLVAGTASTTAMLLGKAQGREWLQTSQFQHLFLDE